MSKVELRLFGSFRRFSEASTIFLEIPPGCTVRDFRPMVAAELARLGKGIAPGELVAVSAIADEREILEEEREIPRSGALAILPPVCGG